jgi:hypothetical protein
LCCLVVIVGDVKKRTDHPRGFLKAKNRRIVNRLKQVISFWGYDLDALHQ